MWDTFMWLMKWPFESMPHYLLGAVIVWALTVIIVTICDDEAVTLLTPFKILGNIFDKEIGAASLFIGACWAPIIWVLIFLVLPGSIIHYVWSFGKGKLGGEMGLANQVRSWLESKVIFDMKKKDVIK